MRAFDRLIVLVLLTSVAGGCDDSWADDDAHVCIPATEPIQDAPGALAFGRFEWECITTGDPACGSGNFPIAVAVGARFGLDYSLSEDVPGTIAEPQLSTVGAALVREGSGFFASGPGVATVVALNNEAAVDFLEIEVKEVTSLTLSRTLAPPAVDEYGCTPRDPAPSEGRRAEVFVGESTEVQALPYGGRVRLGGGLGYSWESLTPETLSVSSAAAGRVARLEGLRAGAGQVLVRTGDYEQTFDFQVELASAETETSSGGDTDGTTGGDTDGTTGGETDGTTGGTTGGDAESSSGGQGETTGDDGTSGGSK